MKVYRNIEDFKDVKNPIVTVGTFDGVHIGHQHILKRLKEVAEENGGETVLLTFFPHPRMVVFPEDNRLKLINTLEEKIKLLEDFGLQHLVILPFSKEFSRVSPTEYVRDFLVNKLNVNTLVIGYDHRFGRNREGDINLLKELSPVYDFKVEEIPAREIDDIKVSSTKIREALSQGDIKTAKEYLQHDFSLNGTVVKGNQIGRTIGFPTANIHVPEPYKLIPKQGVYIVKGKIAGKTYQGLLNIGNRPTIEEKNNEKPTIEAYFLNTSDNLYDQKAEITFIERLRDEKKYNSLEELSNQLKKDEQMAQQYFHSEV